MGSRLLRSRWLGLMLCAGLSAASAAPQPDAHTSTQNTQEQDTQARDTAKQHAEQWNLSVSDWKRYKHLKQGIDGYRSDKLDPITLLGMHARSQSERQKYARKLARMEHKRVQRVLGFQKAYDRASNKLYPDKKRVNAQAMANAMDAGQRDAQKLGLNQAARASVIVQAHDCAACRSKVQQLASSDTPMDIYIVGADSDDAIRAWAKRIGLDADRVRSGDITLNHAPQDVADQVTDDSLPRVIR